MGPVGRRWSWARELCGGSGILAPNATPGVCRACLVCGRLVRVTFRKSIAPIGRLPNHQRPD